MKDWAWFNKYIALVEDKPALIANLNDRNELSEDSATFLKQRFKNFAQVYCEIGSGSGMHLLAQAEKNHEAIFVGYELRYKRAYKTVEKAERRSVDNLFVIRGNAEHLFNLFDAETLSGLYINFPDPWAKTRWLKHRILNNDFFDKLRQKLKPNAFFSFKTDHKDYFEEIYELLKSRDDFKITEFSDDLHSSNFSEQNLRTEFEHLFVSKKLPIMYLKALKS